MHMCKSWGHIVYISKANYGSFDNYYLCMMPKVSVQGVVALGGHFATLCWEVDFHEALSFFKKKRQILLQFL